MEENIIMRNQYYTKNLPNPIDLDDGVNKRYADSKYLKITDYDNDSMVRNNTHTIFNNNALLGLSSIYLNQDPEFDLQARTTKQYVDKLFNNPPIVKNTDHVDFNDKNFDNVRFVNVNSYPAVNSHLTCKEYVDNNINNIGLLIIIL